MSKKSRLLDQFVPEIYEIRIDISKSNSGYFYGKTNIKGQLVTDSDFLLLHSRDLIYEFIKVNNKKVEFELHQDILKLKVKGSRNVEIELVYKSKITDVMHGLYPSFFKYKNRKEIIYSTQLESSYARELFPCIDEPSAKACFKLAIIHRSEDKAISNTPIEAINQNNNITTTQFEVTPKMSTYLLAFACGKIHSISGHSKSGVKINNWSSIAISKSDLKFSLDVSIRALDFYENYFDFKFPLTKIDHIALPDFSSGAMENWGLITYREEAMIVNQLSSIDDKKSVAKVIAHELAHQWFGNLVTMKWWDDLWLNESFATYIEYEAVNYIFPKWNIWDDFLSHESIYALSRDCYENVQPVKVDVFDPDEISSIFDAAIVYAKGARLIGMIKNLIGEVYFKKGLKNYFNRFQFSNANSDDLWHEFNKVSGIDIKTIMQPWLTQPGYPVIFASKNSIKQQRFLLNSKKSKLLWPVPLDSNSETLPDLLNQKSLKFNTGSIYNLNINGFGHFITCYDKSIYSSKANFIISSKSTRFDKLQFFTEEILLARAGIRKYVELLEIIFHMKNEKDYLIWEKFSLVLNDISKLLNKNEKHLLNNFINLITVNNYKALGTESRKDEPLDIQQLRAVILSLRNKIRDIDFLNESTKIYKEKGVNIEDSETRGIILSAAVKNEKNYKIVNSFLEKYPSTISPSLKADLIYAITSTSSDDIHKKIFTSLIDAEIIKPQDIPSWFNYVFAKQKLRKESWLWIKNNWTELEKIYKNDNSIDFFPKVVSRYFNTTSDLNEYINFFENKLDNQLISRSVQIGIEEIHQRIKIITTQKKDLVEKLTNFNPTI